MKAKDNHPVILYKILFCPQDAVTLQGFRFIEMVVKGWFMGYHHI